MIGAYFLLNTLKTTFGNTFLHPRVVTAAPNPHRPSLIRRIGQPLHVAREAEPRAKSTKPPLHTLLTAELTLLTEGDSNKHINIFINSDLFSSQQWRQDSERTNSRETFSSETIKVRGTKTGGQQPVVSNQ